MAEMNDNESKKPSLDNPTEPVRHSPKFQPCPYSPEATNAILEAGRAEYARLAVKKDYDDRVKKGVGRDWNEIIHIDK